MTIATDMGFVVGWVYTAADDYYGMCSVGDKLRFLKDKGDNIGHFWNETKGCDYYEILDDLNPNEYDVKSSTEINPTEIYVNTLRDICHKASYDSGWWTNPDGTSTLTNPLAVSNKLALIHSEISEALEGDRKGSMDDHLPHRKTIECELVDALIRIFDLGGALNLDLGGAFVEKMAYNKTRVDHSASARSATNGKKY